MPAVRLSVTIALVKAFPCGAAAIWLALASMQPGDGLAALAIFLLSLPGFAFASLYVLAGFLLSRPGLLWKSIGAVVEVAVSALVAWVLVSLATYPGALFFANGVDYPPRWTVWALAAVWVAASIVMVAAAIRSTMRRSDSNQRALERDLSVGG